MPPASLDSVTARRASTQVDTGLATDPEPGQQSLMDHAVILTFIIACVSLLYATVGQAGGTAFLAVMAFASFPAAEMRPTALLLNIVAASYATWRLRRAAAIGWGLLLPITLPSLVTAFLGGLLVLDGPLYFTATGILLIAAAGLMLFRRKATPDTATVRLLPAMLAGAAAGFLSGVTGIGGGVFLVPQLVLFGWASAKRAAGISAPFILFNSVLGLAGALIAGQQIAQGTGLYSVGAIVGAVLGAFIGQRWMSERAIRSILAAILLFAGSRLLLR
ncbi:hypothetical protein HMPREF0731_3447 [Pseudoroseomonas cervicalis ATCC 49957]|uniref:Probable membrane transporter protein n=2 Tax=Teichococcus cervicalis TaxID=204525 RepID=D5RQT5_9PROT|nr:hypothetical protein HMPREF0731_3447 [Pseudoroseomonas cervicalis ATCC 49957]